MGTAPNDRQYPAMPDPDRVVRSSLGVLRRLGLSDEVALQVIMTVAARAWHKSSELSPDFRLWLADLMNCVDTRQRSLGRSHANPEGDDNGNR